MPSDDRARVSGADAGGAGSPAPRRPDEDVWTASPPGNGDQVRPLVRRISLLVRALSTETHVYADLVCRRLDIHRTDLSALGHLERARVEGEPMTQADLGRALRMSGAAITALADRLQRTGHVERRRNPLDRRKILLEPTEHARRTGRQHFGPLARLTRAALERYTDEELELVGRVLEDLVRASRTASAWTWEVADATATEQTAGPGGSPAPPARPPARPSAAPRPRTDGG